MGAGSGTLLEGPRRALDDTIVFVGRGGVECDRDKMRGQRGELVVAMDTRHRETIGGVDPTDIIEGGSNSAEGTGWKAFDGEKIMGLGFCMEEGQTIDINEVDVKSREPMLVKEIRW